MSRIPFNFLRVLHYAESYYRTADAALDILNASRLVLPVINDPTVHVSVSGVLNRQVETNEITDTIVFITANFEPGQKIEEYTAVIEVVFNRSDWRVKRVNLKRAQAK